MELLRIGERKLKVMLNASDMEKYHLTRDTIDYDNTETRSAVWQILDEAKHKTGFDAGPEKIFVQVYPGKSGGCEMYVTKIGEEKTVNGRDRRKDGRDGREGRGGREGYDGDGAPVRGSGRLTVYRYPSLETLIAVCRALKKVGYIGESAAYRKEDGSYFLVILEERRGSIVAASSFGKYGFPEEFGSRIDRPQVLSELCEYATCLEPFSAVNRLAAL